MKRIVYSPKAFVYVLNSTPPPGSTPKKSGPYLHNLSDLVVSGSVTRKLDQVSNAEVTFRNPERIYTKPGNPIFRPMDAITIFLQRLPGCPIQTFTGYLDKTPYYQMYPGTATISASCTLKRLQYTYFDPGLPFTMQFMAKYGWEPDGQGGIRKTDKTQGPERFVDQAQDSNISELVFACMAHIAQWRPESIWVEQLPERLMDRLVNLYNAISDENKEASKEFETFLQDYLGTGAYTPDASSDSGSAAGGPADFRQAANKWGNKLGVDPAVLMGIAKIESGFGANQGPSSAGAKGNMQFIQSTRDMILSKYGVDAYKNVDEAVAAAAYYLRDAGFKKSVHDAIYAYNHADWYVNKVLAAAEKYRGDASPSRNKNSNDNTPQDESDKANKDEQTPANADQEKSGGSKDRSSNSTKIFAPIAGGTTGISSPYGESGLKHRGYGPPHAGIDVPTPVGTDCVAPADGKIGKFAQTTGFGGSGGMIHFVFTEDTGDVKAGTVIGWGHVGQVFKRPGDSVKAGEVIAKSNYNASPHVHFIMRTDSNDMDGTTDPTSLFKALQKGETTPTSGGNDAAPDPGNSGQDAALHAAKAVGLMTAFQFPEAVDQAESLLLKGDKSLMNDQPLLPFIEELCRGSMRNFQSMPNGDFYAFHPDYFNSYGTSPYWEIDDIEVLDGNIDLTDDNLATHVYVVGATRTGDQEIDISRRLTTAGVVNVFNAGTADFLNVDSPDKSNDDSKDKNKAKPFLGDMDNTLQFMRRYGARPFVSNNPFIRSHIFETFYAFQTFMLMWSRQFLTPFTFTFMPELYPGGHVSFPTHGIQCYIEEVHHQWDYTTGFLTSANLSAPSALDKSHNISKGMVMGGIAGGPTSTPAPVSPGPNGQQRPG